MRCHHCLIALPRSDSWGWNQSAVKVTPPPSRSFTLDRLGIGSRTPLRCCSNGEGCRWSPGHGQKEEAGTARQHTVRRQEKPPLTPPLRWRRKIQHTWVLHWGFGGRLPWQLLESCFVFPQTLQACLKRQLASPAIHLQHSPVRNFLRATPASSGSPRFSPLPSMKSPFPSPFDGRCILGLAASKVRRRPRPTEIWRNASSTLQPEKQSPWQRGQLLRPPTLRGP